MHWRLIRIYLRYRDTIDIAVLIPIELGIGWYFIHFLIE